MTRLTVIFTLALPGIAFAHPGHEHVGTPWGHHLTEVLLVAGLVAAVFAGTRIYRSLTDR